MRRLAKVCAMRKIIGLSPLRGFSVHRAWNPGPRGTGLTIWRRSAAASLPRRAILSRMTQHATSSSAPTAPEPSHAERVKTLLVSERVATLATQSAKHPGWPFASVMPYALDTDASPIFLISGMAIHTQNLLADPRASLL